MICTEARRLMHGYVDGELDLVTSIAVEAHMADCGSCTQMCSSQKGLKESVRAGSLRFEAPKGLDRRIRAAVAREARQAATPTRPAWRDAFRIAGPALGAAAVALVAFVAWNLMRPGGASRSGDAVVEEVVSSHVRSLMASHLFDVASTDQHTVKPWFTGKLDFSPPVLDLAGRGYPLVGGRLDYLAGRPVAALVYHRRKHVINLFVWPSGPGGDLGGMRLGSLRGYHVCHWTAGGMTYYAASDVSAGDLEEFSRDVAAQERPSVGR